MSKLIEISNSTTGSDDGSKHASAKAVDDAYTPSARVGHSASAEAALVSKGVLPDTHIAGQQSVVDRFLEHEKKTWTDVFTGKGTGLETLEVGAETVGGAVAIMSGLGALGAAGGLLAIEDVGVQTASVAQGAIIGGLFGAAGGMVGAVGEGLFNQKN
jgi:hypothetical protein